MNAFRPLGNRKDNLQQSPSAYARALIEGDADATGRVIEELLNRRCSLSEIYTQVITPALVSIGDLWCSRDISVADEHLATQIVLSHLDRLSSMFAWQERRSSFRLLVACVEGERHYIGARMFADLCLSHGWSAEFLGPDVPNDALIDAVKKRAPHAVALSATVEQGLPHVRLLTRELGALAPAPRIILGGQAIGAHAVTAAAVQRNTVAVASDAVNGLEIALKFLRANRPKVILKEYLVALGRRVRDLRSKKGWTQEHLADVARVTRVCIVAIEGGKQNVSMDIVVRLANALGVAPETLLADDAALVEVLGRSQ